MRARRLTLFLQTSVRSRTAVARDHLLSVIRQVAKDEHSAALNQLASRISTVMKYGNQDVFGKVRGLINSMIAKLEKEAAEEATEKAFCDEELAKSASKNEDLEDELSKLTTKVEQSASRSSELKEEVKVIQADLASLAKQTANLDTIRGEEQSEYFKTKHDLQTGLDGVGQALGVLRSYYQSKEDGDAFLQSADMNFMTQPAPPQKSQKSAGAGGAIISILEVIESDFAKNLAHVEAEEQAESASYEKVSAENKLSKAAKDQDVNFKTKEFKSLDKAIAEITADKETVTSEHEAVLQYLAMLKARCTAKPASYEERTKRRNAEIKGLKEALDILESETAFFQKSRRGLRGSLATES